MEKIEKKSIISVYAIYSIFSIVIALLIIFINYFFVNSWNTPVRKFIFFLFMGFFFLAVVLGIVALIKIRRNPKLKGRRIAIVGIILGLLFLLFVFSMYIIYIWGLSGPTPKLNR